MSDVAKVFTANQPLTGVDIDWSDDPDSNRLVVLTGQYNPVENGVYHHDPATRTLVRAGSERERHRWMDEARERRAAPKPEAPAGLPDDPIPGQVYVADDGRGYVWAPE